MAEDPDPSAHLSLEERLAEARQAAGRAAAEPAPEEARRSVGGEAVEQGESEAQEDARLVREAPRPPARRAVRRARGRTRRRVECDNEGGDDSFCPFDSVPVHTRRENLCFARLALLVAENLTCEPDALAGFVQELYEATVRHLMPEHARRPWTLTSIKRYYYARQPSAAMVLHLQLMDAQADLQLLNSHKMVETAEGDQLLDKGAMNAKKGVRAEIRLLTTALRKARVEELELARERVTRLSRADQLRAPALGHADQYAVLRHQAKRRRTGRPME